jgi:hypothetical protein
VEYNYFYKGFIVLSVVKCEGHCTKGRVMADYCEDRSFGCELGWVEFGEGLVDDLVLGEEEKILGKGGRVVLAKLVEEGWKPIEGEQYAGYLVRGEGDNREFLAPDYNGGFYRK